jgi:hypothetical protein
VPMSGVAGAASVSEFAIVSSWAIVPVRSEQRRWRAIRTRVRTVHIPQRRRYY